MVNFVPYRLFGVLPLGLTGQEDEKGIRCKTWADPLP